MKLIALLFISSCGMNTIKPTYTKQYLVTETYRCPESYNMALDSQNRRFCVIKDNVVRVDKVVTKKTAKQIKKHLKIDCQRVFREMNKCSL